MQHPPDEESYLRDPEEIYRRSFATIRAEAALGHLDPAEASVAERVIHACGMIDIVADLAFTPGAAAAGIGALASGRPVFCDVGMVAQGVIRRLLPADNPVGVTLDAPGVAERAARSRTTRSAAAVDDWLDRIDGAVVAIGNAPTALFHLLNRIGASGPRPALVIGMPVGFVGAVESKVALAQRGDIASIIVHGRRGGSAMAAAAVNALARLAGGSS